MMIIGNDQLIELEMACQHGELDFVKNCFKHNPNLTHYQHLTLFKKAVLNSHMELADYLKDKFETTEWEIRCKPIDLINMEASCSFGRACDLNNIKAVKYFYDIMLRYSQETGKPVQIQWPVGLDDLARTAFNPDKKELFFFLVGIGAKPDIWYLNLKSNCTRGDLDYVKYIHEKTNHKVDEECLKNAIKYGHLEIIKYIFDQGVRITNIDDDYRDSWTWSGPEKDDIMKYLISLGYGFDRYGRMTLGTN